MPSYRDLGPCGWSLSGKTIFHAPTMTFWPLVSARPEILIPLARAALRRAVMAFRIFNNHPGNLSIWSNYFWGPMPSYGAVGTVRPDLRGAVTGEVSTERHS